MFTIDKTTAAASHFLTLGAGNDGEAIGFNPSDGRMYHASGITDGDRFWESIDLGTASVSSSVALVISNEGLALTWNPSTGTFLATSRDNDTFYSITSAGVATDIGSTVEDLKGLAFVGAALYGAAAFSDQLYELDPLDGSVDSSISVTLAGFSVLGMNALAVDPDSGLMYGVIRTTSGQAGRRLATIDPTTGVATDIGVISGGTGWSGLAFGPGAAVPEPGTLALLALGLAGLGWRRRLA